MAETLRRRSPSEQAAWQEGYQYGLKMGARSEPPVPGETWAETQARRQRNLDGRPRSSTARRRDLAPLLTGDLRAALARSESEALHAHEFRASARCGGTRPGRSSEDPRMAEALRAFLRWLNQRLNIIETDPEMNRWYDEADRRLDEQERSASPAHALRALAARLRESKR